MRNRSIIANIKFLYMSGIVVRFFVFEVESPYVTQAVPELLGSSDPLVSAS